MDTERVGRRLGRRTTLVPSPTRCGRIVLLPNISGATAAERVWLRSINDSGPPFIRSFYVFNHEHNPYNLNYQA